MEAFILYLLKSAGVLAIFFLSYHWLLKQETFFRTNRHFLLAGILASLLLPFVVLTKYVYVEPEPFNPLWLLADVPVTVNSIQEPEPFNWMNAILFTYAIIALVLSIRFLVQLTSLFKLIQKHGVTKINGFKLVETNGNISPFSFFNYIVYNPKKYNTDDLNIILNHEKAHGKQLHSIDIIIAQLFTILQWFNPIAWLYKKSIQQNLEFMADQSAITKAECSKHYQHTLLRASLKPQYASITNNFYNSLIKKRIVMLNQSKSKTKNAWKYFVILPALTLFLMSFNVKTVEVVKETNNPETSTDNVFFTDDNTPEITLPKSKENIVLSSIEPIKQNQKPIGKDPIKIKIDSNTSDADLKGITEKLKQQGIDFSFKNVKRNANNEIIGINVKYKDKDGNTGNYSLINDEPINAFYFIKDDNEIGFVSEGISMEQRQKLMEAREMAKAKHMEWREEHEEEMEERKAEMEERRKEIEESREEIEVRVREAREKHREAMEKHKENYEVIIKERKKLHDSLRKNRQVFINGSDLNDKDIIFIVDGDEFNKENMKISPEQIAKINVLKGDRAIKMYGDKGKNGVVQIFTKDVDDDDFEFEFDDHFVEPDIQVFTSPDMKFEWIEDFKNIGMSMIKKNTSDAELKRIKSKLEEKNIDFKYNKVKRNNSGEITRIKVSLNDDQGNKSSSTFDTGNKGINPILVGKNKNSLIIKSI